jgi:hypothetical protein
MQTMKAIELVVGSRRQVAKRARSLEDSDGMEGMGGMGSKGSKG